MLFKLPSRANAFSDFTQWLISAHYFTQVIEFRIQSKTSLISRPNFRLIRTRKFRNYSLHCKQFFIVTIPVTLKTLLWIVLQFQIKKFSKLRVTSLYLIACYPSVISEKKPSTKLQYSVNKSGKVSSCVLNTGIAMDHVQVTDNAYQWFCCPSQKTLVVFGYETYGAVSHIDLVFYKVTSYFR